MKSITMMSHADMTKGHGVLSVYDELNKLLKTYYPDKYEVRKNSLKKSDIYHYHTINPTFMLSMPIAKHRGATVGFVHFVPATMEDSLHLWKIAKAPFYWYMLKFYAAMDFLVTVNPNFRNELIKSGVKPERIKYIPNCVGGDGFFEMTAEEKSEVRKKFGIPEDRPIIIGAGQLQIRKGVLDFVEVAKNNPDKFFMWLGGFSFGKITDGYDEIKAITENPPENLKFVGMVEREEMNAYYNAADILFLPSYAELFPMTILEAFNCKLPILVRDIPEYHGIVSDYCIMRSSNEEFNKEIDLLFSDKSYFADAKERSAKGGAYYSTENVAKIWDEFYTEVLTKSENKKKSKQKGGK